MKLRGVYLLCLLVCPMLARPNVEPIYQRQIQNQNPLEVLEESVEATTLGSLPGAEQTVTEQQNPKTQLGSQTLKRAESFKTKVGTSGYVVSTSAKILHNPALRKINDAKVHGDLASDEKYSGHQGIAEPLTEEEYQHELHRATEKIYSRKEFISTTTAKEGLSTWVLLSGSGSTEMKKEATTSTTTTTIPTTAAAAPSSTRKPFVPPTKRVATTGSVSTTTRRPPTTVARRMTTFRAASTVSPTADEKKERTSKPMHAKPKPSAVPKLESTTAKIDFKRTKKTTTTTTTPAPATQSASTATVDISSTEPTLSASLAEDNSIESSTFLILEPKDAQFDLPEDRSPAKTAKNKKPTRKTGNGANKKKPGNKKTKKPELKDVLNISLGEKKPPNKSKPVSTQIINYLSREVMPTVGVGLVGLMMAAGLASYFLGSPLTALRRSDETNRKDDIYYSNYEDYAGADGQNEEDVFGKLIAGMPDRSYYRNSLRRRTPPARTGHQYGPYHVQNYASNKYPQITYRNRAYNSPDIYATMSQPMPAKPQNEFFYNTPPSMHTKPHSPVFVKAEAPIASTESTAPISTTSHGGNNPLLASHDTEHEMIPSPEAYSAEHNPEQHAHYAVGDGYSDRMLDVVNSAPVPEHGPRRRREAVDHEEIDNEIRVDDDHVKDSADLTAMDASVENELSTTPEVSVESQDEKMKYTWTDFVRKTIEMKLAMGINFLQHVTTDFQRYLNGVQHRFVVQFNQTANH